MTVHARVRKVETLLVRYNDIYIGSTPPRPAAVGMVDWVDQAKVAESNIARLKYHWQ